jgi:tellurite resistance protein
MSQNASTAVKSAGLKHAHGVAEMPSDVFMAVAKAFKVVLAADGTISPPEHDAYVETCKNYGASESMMGELEAFDPFSTTLEKLLGSVDKAKIPARGLLYDSVRVASADGDFAKAEDIAVHKAAKLLGLDDAVVDSIIAIVKMEEAVRTARLAVLGTPSFA